MSRPKGVKDSSPTAFANRSAAKKRVWADPSYRERTVAAARAAWTPERRAAMGELVRARYDDPAYRKKVSAAVAAVCSTPEHRAKLAELRQAEAAKRRAHKPVRDVGFADLVARLVAEPETT